MNRTSTINLLKLTKNLKGVKVTPQIVEYVTKEFKHNNEFSDLFMKIGEWNVLKPNFVELLEKRFFKIGEWTILKRH